MDKPTIQPNKEERFLNVFGLSIISVTLKKVNNLPQAIKAGTPSLGKVITDLGIEFVQFYVELWLADLNEVTGVKNPLNDAQIQFISQQVVREFRNLTIADVYLIFQNAKTGVYGKMYERLSPVDVLIWFRNYFKERCDVCALNSIEEHRRIKENPSEGRNSEMTVKGMLKKMKDEK